MNKIHHKLSSAIQYQHSAKIMLRVLPEIHARAAMIAEAHGKSLNSWMTELLANAG